MIEDNIFLNVIVDHQKKFNYFVYITPNDSVMELQRYANSDINATQIIKYELKMLSYKFEMVNNNDYKTFKLCIDQYIKAFLLNFKGSSVFINKVRILTEYELNSFRVILNVFCYLTKDEEICKNFKDRYIKERPFERKTTGFSIFGQIISIKKGEKS